MTFRGDQSRDKHCVHVTEPDDGDYMSCFGVLQERFPQFKIPDGEDVPAELKIDNSRAQRELGLRITPARQTMIDGAVTLIQLGEHRI